MTRKTTSVLLAAVLVIVGTPAGAQPAQQAKPPSDGTTTSAKQPGSGKLEFKDVRRQTAEFMRYNKQITLTPEQEAIHREALTGLEAPCCSDKTAYTCCCPCNMARAWWGLSKHLITERGHDAEQVRSAVAEWFKFINPTGYTGDACYTGGGCNRAFANNGCGGMVESRVIWN